MGQKLHVGVAAVTIMMHFHSHISFVTAPLFNPIFLKCEDDPIFLGKNFQGPIWVVLSSQLFHRMLARSGSRFRAVGRGVRYTLLFLYFISLVFSRKTFRRRVLQKIVGVSHTTHIPHISSTPHISHTYPFQTYPTKTYPFNTYPTTTLLVIYMPRFFLGGIFKNILD